jgi:hypothetical protein
MTATVTQARDEMLATFRTAWTAGPPSSTLPVLYPDVSQEVPSSGAWARVMVKHSYGEQATLSGETGQRRFRHTGIITVQIFTPTGDGQVLNDQLIAIAKGAFEGVTTSPGRIMFRNVRINEVGQDGQWFQVNVLADFEYDEVK